MSRNYIIELREQYASASLILSDIMVELEAPEGSREINRNFKSCELIFRHFIEFGDIRIK